MLKKIIRKVKDFLLFTRVFLLFKPFRGIFKSISNFSSFTEWVSKVDKKELLINDFYNTKRIHDRRFKLHEKVGQAYGLNNKKINYLEFGVASGSSFRWWVNFNKNPESHFAGFDTFEGLPEDWGTYKKGEMDYGMPKIEDTRAELVKGLFQDTLHPFLNKKTDLLFKDSVSIIHLDADLFTATIFVLTQLYKYLKKGDIIFFDELSVPNHEYQAFKIFVDSFGVKLKPLGAVNNFYQVAFIIE